MIETANDNGVADDTTTELRALRPYQVAALRGIAAEWQRVRSTLLVLPTGTGKTVVFADVIRRRAYAGRALVLAHREELLTQAADKLRDVGIAADVEQGDRRADVFSLTGVAPVVVASVQTLHARRLQRWPADHFATVVVDEAHHGTARSYRAILDHFRTAKVLGVTATPDRGDGVGLRAVFESVAYEYGIRDAIRDGFLAPIRQRAIECADLDISDVKSARGDLADGELQQAMTVDAVLHQVAGPLVREAGERSTVAFVAGVQHAHALVEVLSGYVPPTQVAAITGDTSRDIREEVIERFKAGDLRFLVNVGVLTEGFDAARTACVAIARPTKSRALYAQMIGRGTRLCQGKEDCLVLDFVGNSGRHALVSAGDVLAGKPLPDDVKRDVQRAQADGMDLESALAHAEEKARQRHDEAEARKRRRHVRADVRYRAQNVSPFDVLGVDADSTGPRATDAQLAALSECGVRIGTMPSRREATSMLDAIRERRRAGVCSYKQAVVLSRHGLPTDVGFEEAGRIIDAISSNGWRVPESLRRQYAERERGTGS